MLNKLVNDSNGIVHLTMEDGTPLILDHDIAEAVRTKIIDADGAVFFARELEYVKAEAFEVKRSKIKFRDIFPISNEIGKGATTHTYDVLDGVGMAEVISAYANDIPTADVSAKQVTGRVHIFAIGFKYTQADIDAGARTGKALDRRKAKLAVEGMERKHNKTAWAGDSSYDLQGLLDNPNIPTGQVAEGGNASTLWVDKEASEILFDINLAFSEVEENTLGNESANTLLLPIAQRNYIATTSAGTGEGSTILGYLVKNSPWLESMDDVISVNELKAENSFGELSEDAFVVYDRNSDKLVYHITYELEFIQVQQLNFVFTVPGSSGSAGLTVYIPLSISINTGI